MVFKETQVKQTRARAVVTASTARADICHAQRILLKSILFYYK